MMNISSKYSWKTTSSRKNSPLLPSNIRGLIIGKSNSGKTTLIFNLLLQPDWLDYDHLYVFGKSLHQPEYQIIKKGFTAGLSKQQISNIFIQQDILSEANISPQQAIDQYDGFKEGGAVASFYDGCSEIPDPSELNAHDKNLLILDDCFLGKQNKAEAYYSRGRHNNCDTIYISQNYFRLPRQTIRENSNLIILFPQDSKNLNHIYADHCTADISMNEFKAFCKNVWSNQHDFITLDLTSTSMDGKYRKNLNCFYFPETTGNII